MDMLVRLYDLPPLAPALERCAAAGISIRPARAYEMHLVVGWVRQTFGEGWASEAAVCFSRQPVSCFIAVEAGAVIGFGCYESTCRGFFGPTGVAESARGRGAGAALLLACLHAMATLGYAYAVIGGVGPAEFYARTCGAMPIEGSTPGLYRDRLHAMKPQA